MDWLLVFWSDQDPTSGRTSDFINNLINNFKIIKVKKIYILSFLTKNIQVKHIYKI